MERKCPKGAGGKKRDGEEKVIPVLLFPHFELWPVAIRLL